MRILLIEDSTILRESVSLGLRALGHLVDASADGEDGLWRAEARAHDVLLLDLGLPKIDGLEILSRLRAAGDAAPILILTARDAVADRIAGLRAGADDYLVKPFAFDELVARIDVLYRRSKDRPTSLLVLDGLQIDLAARSVTLDGAPLTLSKREFALLELLAANAGRVVTRAEIESRLYDDAVELSSNAVDASISILRKAIRHPDRPPRIVTHRGIGYRMPAP